MPPPLSWTEEADRLILRLRLAGATWDEIAGAAGVSRWSTIARGRRRPRLGRAGGRHAAGRHRLSLAAAGAGAPGVTASSWQRVADDRCSRAIAVQLHAVDVLVRLQARGLKGAGLVMRQIEAVAREAAPSLLPELVEARLHERWRRARDHAAHSRRQAAWAIWHGATPLLLEGRRRETLHDMARQADPEDWLMPEERAQVLRDALARHLTRSRGRRRG